MRKLLTALFAAFMATALTTPGALADHDDGNKKAPGAPHQAMPTDKPVLQPEAECAVTGAVNIVTGVAADMANHNHYNFVGAQIICASANPRLTGAFAVAADGGTDGCNTILNPDHPNHCTTRGAANNSHAHGEWDGNGWSHSSLYGGSTCDTDGKSQDNKGDIVATHPDGTPYPGYVKFLRVGSTVEAWGCLDVPDKGFRHFVAELEFIPQNVEPGEKVTDALLVGDAVVGTKIANVS